MKKKALGFMLAATMTVSVFAGCGGNQNEGNTNEKENVTNSNEDTQSVSAETNENGDETLTVWCWDPTFNIYAMEQAEKIYQKDHPDFKLDIQENIYNDIETKLITAATSGDYSTLPDIFLMQDYSFHKNIANFPGIFTELTDSGIDFSQFVQRDRDAGQQFAANAHAAKFLPPGKEKRRTILHGAALFFAYCVVMGRNVP